MARGELRRIWQVLCAGCGLAHSFMAAPPPPGLRRHDFGGTKQWAEERLRRRGWSKRKVGWCCAECKHGKSRATVAEHAKGESVE